MDDPPVSPVAPIGVDPVEALEPPAPRVPRPDEVARPGTMAPTEAEAQVSTPITRAQLERPVVPPASSGVVAAIHDAAEHGNAIADAIERAHTADPSDRAQQLGGAAASAASGQSTPADEPPPVDVDEREPRVDPLAPIDPNHPAQARDPREEQGRTSE